jgi:hypothetical protein
MMKSQIVRDAFGGMVRNRILEISKQRKNISEPADRPALAWLAA